MGALNHFFSDLAAKAHQQASDLMSLIANFGLLLAVSSFVSKYKISSFLKGKKWINKS